MQHHRSTPARLAVLMLALALAACSKADDSQSAPESSPSALLAPTPAPPPPIVPPPPPQAGPVVLLAGGDIDLSRRTGQRILRSQDFDPFVELRPLLESADLRFANLESQLCDLGGKTGSPENKLIFAGPPPGAEVISRGLFDVISTANNHAWDFGHQCLSETISNLQRIGVEHVGTDEHGRDAMGPRILERNGQRLAFFAQTGIFNHGLLAKHKARGFIADADMQELSGRIAKVRDEVDWVVVSLHAGEEYATHPIPMIRDLFHAAVDAGADIVLGHHSHTPQHIVHYKDRPVIFSLGNLVFHEHSEQPWTAFGYLARITFVKSHRPTLEVCPHYLFDAAPRLPTQAQERAFWSRWEGWAKGPGVVTRTTRSSDGCYRMQ